MTTAAARWSVAQSLAIDAHTAEVVSALQAADVPVVLLKGPSIARWLYTDGTPRPYGDSDLLVPDDRWLDAGRVLERLGLLHRPIPTLALDPTHHASNWARADGSGHVDLHWTLPMVDSRDKVWSVVVRDAEAMVVGGCELLIPSEPMRALHVVLHAVQHGPAYGKPLEDLRRSLELLPDETWVGAHAVATELGAVAAMALGLQLLPEGGALAARLSIGAVGATYELRLRAQGAPVGSQTLARVLAQPTWRRRAGAARARILPPVSFVRLWDEQTTGVRGGIVGAYWRRIRRVVVATPAAVRSYVRLRRRSGRE